MKTIIILGLSLAVVGCDRTEASVTQAASAPADNTKKNERDRAASVSPTDQGNNAVDLGITQQIRQGVMKADALSMTAKNVKIITVDGMVTLRGPVTSDRERADVVAIARTVAGVKHVDNQLEIAAN